MKLRTLFALDAVASVLLALGFLLGPATMLKFLGLTQGKTEILLGQILGAALIGFAALAWFGRQSADFSGSPGNTCGLDQLQCDRLRGDVARGHGAGDACRRCLGARSAVPAPGSRVCVLSIRGPARVTLTLKVATPGPCLGVGQGPSMSYLFGGRAGRVQRGHLLDCERAAE